MLMLRFLKPGMRLLNVKFCELVEIDYDHFDLWITYSRVYFQPNSKQIYAISTEQLDILSNNDDDGETDAKWELIVDSDQLLVPCANDFDLFVLFTQSGMVKSLAENAIVIASTDLNLDESPPLICVDFSTIYLTSDGNHVLSSAKIDGNRFELVYRFVNAVKELKAGSDFVVVRTQLDYIYTFGNNLRGQLGSGCLESAFEPQRVVVIDGCSIRSLGVGGWHTLIALRDEGVYGWGWNQCGQIKQRTSHDETVLYEPAYLDVGKVERVSCGRLHSIFEFADSQNYTITGLSSHNTSFTQYASELSRQNQCSLEIKFDKRPIRFVCGLYMSVFVFEEKDQQQQ